MKFPAEVLKIIMDCAMENGDDIPAAVRDAKCQIEDLNCFDDLVDQLITDAIRDLIYDARHIVNVKTKRQTGRYVAPSKVDRGSPAVRDVYRSVYDYNLAGKTLGSFFGKELMATADAEEERARGFTFNATLLRRMMPQVPADKQVREVIPETKLRSIFKSVEREVNAKVS